MSLQDEYIASTDPALQSRVQMATLTAAQNISTEATDTANHTNRVSLAQQVSRAPEQFKVPFTSICCAEGITNQSADADIENMVASVWNTLAGPPITPAPPPVP